MNFTYKTIDSKKELAQYKKAILFLFNQCFLKEFDEETWQWAYIDNPVGQPIVSLCFNEENTLIGHYALISIPFIKGDVKIKACLSMTTMVHAHYRRYGIFSSQAQQVFEKAHSVGYQVVYGFPNTNSAPGFQKRLAWTIHSGDFVACLSGKELAACRDFLVLAQNDHLVTLDMDNEPFVKWRLSKPGAHYFFEQGMIMKKYHPHDDLVFLSRQHQVHTLADSKINILVDSTINSLRIHRIFDYPFGYRVFDEALGDLHFRKDLLMSDIF